MICSYTDCSGSFVVCISPLISIMVDQRAKFTAFGLKAEYVGTVQEDPGVVHQVLAVDVQLLFISPENILNNKHFRGMLLSQHYKQHLVTGAVDETVGTYVARILTQFTFQFIFYILTVAKLTLMYVHSITYQLSATYITE